jgi:hypothetical protein
MKTYNITTWQDHVVDPGTGAVIQQGTPQSATNFNNEERGIFSSNESNSVLFQQAIQHQRLLLDFEGQISNVTLNNSLEYPFNNSKVTVNLSKSRDTVNYTVTVEVVSNVGGSVGEIKITDKAVNGFKIEFTGSASSVVVKYYVQGGMYQ